MHAANASKRSTLLRRMDECSNASCVEDKNAYLSEAVLAWTVYAHGLVMTC